MRSKNHIDVSGLNITATHINGLYVNREGRIFGLEETGYYEIFPYLNKPTGNWRIKQGYYRFRFEKKMYQVHNVLARTYVPGYKQGLVVDHINGDSTDNRIENLQWITRGQNVAKFWETKTEEEKEAYRKKYSESVKNGHALGHYKEHYRKLSENKKRGRNGQF